MDLSCDFEALIPVFAGETLKHICEADSDSTGIEVMSQQAPPPEGGTWQSPSFSRDLTNSAEQVLLGLRGSRRGNIQVDILGQKHGLLQKSEGNSPRR